VESRRLVPLGSADGGPLGPLSFDEDTAKRFREDVLDPFLRRFLKGESVEAPAEPESATECASDPQKPVPYAPRPQWGFDYDNPSAIGAWRRWLVEDQRFVDGRPDVATWQSEPLAAPLTIRGPFFARLFAETTGSDADWVVKLIDVYPDHDPGAFEMSGYELMVSADIFRGRYRESLERLRARARTSPAWVAKR